MTVHNSFKDRAAINSSIKLTDRKAGHFYRHWTQTGQSRTASGFLAWTPLVKTKESLMSGVACDFYDYFHHQNKIQKGKGLTFIGVYEQFNCIQYFDLLFGHAGRGNKKGKPFQIQQDGFKYNTVFWQPIASGVKNANIKETFVSEENVKMWNWVLLQNPVDKTYNKHQNSTFAEFLCAPSFSLFSLYPVI